NSSPVSQARSSTLQRKYSGYRKAELEYMSQLRKFYEQAIHVAVVNIRTGKLIEDSAEKRTIITELENKGVKSRFLQLSEINLWEASIKLLKYQKEFQNLFSEKIDMQVLNELEKSETKTLNTLLWSWFIFVDKPRTALIEPEKQIQQRIDNRFEQIKSQISEMLKGSFPYGDTKILEEKTEWDSHPAVWIQLDSKPTISEINKFDELIDALRTILGQSEYGTFEYSFTDTYMQFLVVVMTIEGKSIDRKVYPLKTILTLLHNHKVEEKPYLYIPQEISHEEIESTLNIPMWELESLHLANDFETSFVQFMVKLSSLEQIGRLPDFPDELESTLQDYLLKKSAEVTEDLQTFIDTKSEILDFFQRLPRDETDDEISAIIEILRAVDEELIIKDGTLHLSSAQFTSYIETLQTITPYISVIRLTYLFTIINRGKTK
ncbi:MAG: hypothetical protein SVR94_17390, partial [Pseudomonadota bacterium]|nr:hypothetical protein [Pseudomonadota bacterium]